MKGAPPAPLVIGPRTRPSALQARRAPHRLASDARFKRRYRQEILAYSFLWPSLLIWPRC